MELEVYGKQILKVEKVITKVQTAIVKTFYCFNYKTILEYDSTNKKINATVYNYLDEVQTNFSESIIFDYEGSQVSIMPVNGVAEIDFNVTLAGDHTVRTVNEMINNGEVIIHVE